MKRNAKSLAAGLACLVLGALVSPAAFGQSVESETPVRRTGDEPTVFSVLVMAKEAAESGRNEAVRLPLRYRVAVSARITGQEAAFGEYVINAITGWEFWDPFRSSPERLAERQHQKLEAEAKRAFLTGDAEGARRLLGERQCRPGMCVSSAFSIDSLFLNWELETGDLSAATRRLRETDWKRQKDLQIHYAGRVAKAFIDAGRANEGFEILSELHSNPDVDRALIAQTYWRLGAIEEGKTLMRAAVNAAFDEAERDRNKQLPAVMAGVQWAMGDRDGAIDTLRRIQQFSADRLHMVRAPLAGRLAFAGLDADAFSLLEDTVADRAILANIVIGQARRGDFDAAFETLERLPKFALPRIEDNSGNPGPVTAVGSIMRNGARAGNADAFRRAEAIYRELRPRWARGFTIVLGPHKLVDNPEMQVLRDLARAGQARLALEYALAAQDLEEKVQGLCRVAEGLADLPDPYYDPLGFLDSW